MRLPPRESFGERSRVWAVGLGLLLLATAGAFVLGREAAEAVLIPAALGRGGAAREAPDLVGRRLDEARRRAVEAGSSLDVLGMAYGPEADSGEVLEQFPPEGMPLEDGEALEVIVSAGAGVRRVPDVRGFSEADARSLLDGAGIRVSASQRVDAEGAAEGVVAGTRPDVGSPLEADAAVTLLVSRGGAVVEVPDVRGRTREEAAKALTAVRLAVGRVSGGTLDAEPAEGQVVVRQSPPAGGLARSGSTVDLELGPRREHAED